VNDALETTAQNALGRRLTLTELAQSASESQTLRKTIPDLQYFAKLATRWPLPFKARRLSDNPASPLYNKYLAGPVLVLPNSPEEDIVDSLLLQPNSGSGSPLFARESTALGGTAEQFWCNETLGQFASQFRLNPHLTLEGLDVRVRARWRIDWSRAFSVAAKCWDPSFLLALSQFTPVSADYQPTLLPGASLLRQVAYKDRPLVFVPASPVRA